MSDNHHEWLLQGRRKLAGGQFQEAKELFEQAVAEHPDSAEAHAWLAAAYGRLIEIGTMLEKMTLLPDLENEIAAALDLDPALPFARRMNGARLLNAPEMLGGDPAAAAKEFTYCIDNGMDEAEIWASLAECYLKLGDRSKASQALQEALKRDPEDYKLKDLWQHLADGH
ncbi:tetratricopeptide repeat protein [Paenibacillus sp. PL2-23]|uniref:tetratricopeptide repeat protein n=1 Tax=Paenibacillus sp. PL2-23 TaxID=2100729 RepID=UPI0030FC29C8